MAYSCLDCNLFYLFMWIFRLILHLKQERKGQLQIPIQLLGLDPPKKKKKNF